MKFFIDTANLTEIREAASLGVLDGVTTNPSLVAKEGHRDFKGLIRQICDIVDGPVSAEVVSTELNGMMKEAEELAALHKNVVVKIPIIREGLKAIKRCAAQGIRVNTTLVFSASQALLAAKAGAAYVSPFIGRLDDVSEEGMNLIRQIRRIFDNYGFECEILAASIRHPLHVVDAALAGADVATIPYKVIDQLLNHPLTDAGLKKFLDDWKNIS
jgi:transaldolase